MPQRLAGACTWSLLAVSACASRFEVETTPGVAASASASASTAPTAPPPPPGDTGVDAAPPNDAGKGNDAAGDAPVIDAADAASTRKRVFVTSTTYKGNDLSTLGGVTGARGADVLCGKVAVAAGLIGRFDAWISDMDANAAARLADPGPFYDVTRRTLVFDKNPALGPPLVAIPDENGALGAMRTVWTGSSAAGVKLNDCDRWTGGGSMGTVGNANTPASFASAGTVSCDSSRRLYCFER